MQIIRIESLPFEQPIDIPAVIRAINRDLAQTTSLDLDHLHTCWSTLNKGFYARGDTSPDYQPELGHPLLVEVLSIGVIDQDLIRTMLSTVADSISRHASFPRQNIFVFHRQTDTDDSTVES